MTNSNHGGPRPKTSDSDQRGRHHSPKPGSGRTPKSFTLKLGDVFFCGMSNPEGKGVLPGEIWTVVEITRSHVKLKSDTGYSHTLIR